MIKRILAIPFILFSLWLGQSLAVAAVAPPQVDVGRAAGVKESSIAPARLEVINKIMADAGVDEMVAQLPDMVAMGFDQQHQQSSMPIEKQEFDQFRATLLRAFDPARTRPVLVRFLDEHYDERSYADMIALLNTPLAKKMTALELASQTPQAQQEMMAFANTTLAQLSPSRQGLIERIDRAHQASEALVETQTMIAGAIMRNINRIVPEDKKLPAERLTQMLAQMREQMLPPSRQFMRLNMAYAYRSVADDELAEYTRLVESETGRALTGLLRDAWLHLFEDLSREVADHVSQQIKTKNAR